MKRLALAVGAFMLLACAEQQNTYAELAKTRIPQGVWENEMDLATPSQLTVVDDTHQPVVNATVMIGEKPGDPFNGNVLTTNAAGQVSMPADFKSALPVTVSAPGYIAQTYEKFSPNGTLVQLHKKEGNSNIEIKGTTTNYGNVINGDGKVDFGLVIPALPRSRLLSFDLSAIVSPQNDTISIVGHNVNIPSNLTLPKQSETYIIVPVNLNKPNYRVYVRDPGTYQLAALHGWFPLSQVVNDMRGGKSVFDEINYFQFTQSGLLNVNAHGNTAGQNINIGQNAMDASFSAQAPNYNANNEVLAFGLAESNGLYVPTDLKRLRPNQVQRLKGSSALRSRAVLQLMVANPKGSAETHALQADDLLALVGALQSIFSLKPNANINMNQYSFAVQQPNSPAPTLIPLVAPPTMANGQLQLTAPALPSGLRAVGTYAVYSDIVPVAGGAVHTEIRTRLWELWSDGWVNAMPLPEMTFNKVSGHTYRWEVVYLAKEANSQPDDGIESIDIDNVTYGSRNFVNAP